MTVTTADVTRAYDAAKDAAVDASGNSASESRCVDALKLLAGMEVPLALFTDSVIGGVAKGIKKLSKDEGAPAGVRDAAKACVKAWKKSMASQDTNAKKDIIDEPCKSVDADGGVKQESGGGGGGDGGDNSDGISLASGRQLDAAQPTSGGEGDADEDDDDDARGADDGEEKDMKQLLEPELGDQLRDRTRELLANAIALCVGREGVYASRKDVAHTAAAVEKAMFTRWMDTGKEYKAKFRQLAFNLKDLKNPDLRASVADGLISPAVLLDLSPEELGSDKRRSGNEKIREDATNEAVRGQKKEASTDAFKCGKCKKRMCTYYQLQTRSADEPMTTFVTCVNCDNRWKFC